MLSNQHSESVTVERQSAMAGALLFIDSLRQSRGMETDSHRLLRAIAYRATRRIAANNLIDWASTTDRLTDGA